MNDDTPTSRYGKTRVPADADGHLIWHWDDIVPDELAAQWQLSPTAYQQMQEHRADLAATDGEIQTITDESTDDLHEDADSDGLS